jgi:hypothetical protein
MNKFDNKLNNIENGQIARNIQCTNESTKFMKVKI